MLRDDPDALLGGLPKARAVKVKPVRTASTSGEQEAAYDVGVITLDPGVATPPPEPPVLVARREDAERDASTLRPEKRAPDRKSTRLNSSHW